MKPLAMEAESMFLYIASAVLQLSSGSLSVLHDGSVLHEPVVDCRREAPVNQCRRRPFRNSLTDLVAGIQ
jgi:hypothetical protein